MALMCHVIATSVRSSGFWWANCWSALASHVRSDIRFGSRVMFFVKAFPWFADKKSAFEILTTFSPITFFPALLGRGALTVYSPAKTSDTICIDLGWGSMANQWDFLHWLSLFLCRRPLSWSPEAFSQFCPSDWLKLFSKQREMSLFSTDYIFICRWPFTHMVSRCLKCIKGTGSS